MKKLCSLFIICLSVLSSNLKAQEHNPHFIGYWYGLLEIQSNELILTFEIKVDNDMLTGLMNSPLQGANNINIDEIIVNQDSLILTIKRLGIKYKGVLQDNDSIIEGVFSQSILNIPLSLQKTKELFTLNRPQEPKPPFNYIEEEITFFNSNANINLSGTLTYPDSSSSYPAVVLITGSGPQDRNEEILGHKPFWVIADYLTNHGIAVLRFDDRGIGKSEGVFSSATSLDFATDVESAISFLKTHPNINKSQIGLIGHSEGGLIASIVASKDNGVAFIIMLAGPAISGEQILLTQQRKIMEVENIDDSIIDLSIKDSRKIYKILKKDNNKEKAGYKIRDYLAKRAKKIPTEHHATLGYSKQAIENKILILNTDWFRYFVSYNPDKYFEAINCPTLALFGEKDVQVTAVENSEAFAKFVNKRNNFSQIVYQNKNHLFQNATTGHMSEYALIEETFCENVLDDIAKWILKTLNKN